MTIRQIRFKNFFSVLLLVATCGIAGLVVPAFAGAATYTVDSTGDQAQQTAGSENCVTTVATCTLRAAIEAADAGTGEDEIVFSASFNGELADTIALGSPLPAIDVPGVKIDGESSGACMTAAGRSGPCVGVSGPNEGTTLEADARRITITGLALSGAEIGVVGNTESETLIVTDNWVGTKLDGTAALDEIGIELVGAASIEGNTIEGGEVGIVAAGPDPVGSTIADNTISGTSASGILIENEHNQVLGNKVSGAGAAGIRIHGVGGEIADENQVGGPTFDPSGPDSDENVIDNSTGPAIEINTPESAKSNRVLRNSGSGNSEAFIKLVKANSSEAKAPNNNIQPPVISAATTGEASGTSLPEAFVRVYAKDAAEPGELGAFLGLAEADTSGNWSLTYTAPAGTIYVAASQTPEQEELGSSALSAKQLQFSLKVNEAGSGSGTVTSSPAGINCGSTCEALFGGGVMVTLSGSAASGSNPVVWSGCDAVVGSNECQVTLAATKAVTATFETTPSSGGSGGGTGGSTPTPSPTPTPAPTPIPSTTKPKPLKCKAGFKKKTVKGVARCVKVKKHTKHK